ncbi:TetR/AcrR family transcriptional regulator [Orenia marismortui]|uniref:TetR/AcrR family transcriptional regulator n=1 Tax=Orenia marismortui TaxID=46469 RepID=UPI00036465C1|nr:TetR/AcrR family transcriptional regulator [Orenia marismortui]
MTRISKKPEIRKNEILDVAEELFAKEGFDNTPVSKIVNKVGVAKGTFYYYFNSKEDIIVAILERRFNYIKKKINKVINDKTYTPIKKLEMLLIELIFPHKEGNNYVNNIKIDENAKIHQKRDVLFFEIFEPYIEMVVKEGVEKGSFNTNNIGETSKILFLGIDRYIHICYNTLNNKKILDKRIKAITEVIERVLGIEGNLNLR